MNSALPTAHPDRHTIHDEIHSRFSQAIAPPARASWIALLSPREAIGQERECAAALCRHFGVDEPMAAENFLARDLGPLRMRWERHNEFSSWAFFVEGPFDAPFDHPPITQLPSTWLASLPGETLAAIHLALEARDAPARSLEAIAALFAGNTFVGNRVAGGDAEVWTDLRIHEDGFSRFLVRDIDLTQRQAGRTVQRLFEMETYRLMALLAWPMAKRMMSQLNQLESRLNRLSDEMAALPHLNAPDRPQQLLAELTGLAAEVEHLSNHTSTRLQASQAYAALVDKRFEQMRAVRIPGLQTLCGYINRRLDPAMRTCHSLSERLESLARRISRTGDLLRTRVDVLLEQQNRDLLRSMNRRAHLQLRLQETVEGLSVIVISYYLTGLIGYLLKGSEAAIGLPIPVNVAIGLSVPLVVVTVWLTMRRMRSRLMRRHGAGEADEDDAR